MYTGWCERALACDYQYIQVGIPQHFVLGVYRIQSKHFRRWVIARSPRELFDGADWVSIIINLAGELQRLCTT